METVIELLKETSALLQGHFLLSSGKHSDKYFQCAKLLQYPDKAQKALEGVAREIKKDINEGNLKIDLVCGPALGGIIAAWELARQLGLPAIFTERDENGEMSLRRGFEVKEGLNILIAEDVVTTGKSSRECAVALEKHGARPSALACVVDRRAEGEPDVFSRFYSAVKLSAKTWEAGMCELCNKGIPAEKPGSRKI